MMYGILTLTSGLVMMAGLALILFYGGGFFAWWICIGGGLAFAAQMAITIYVKTHTHPTD